MALTIYRSNRVEVLQARLSSHLVNDPLEDPFATEVIVVPTYAMSRWLNLEIARQQGIAANIRYPLAENWAWSLAHQVLEDVPAQDPLTGAMLGWRSFNALPDLLQTAGFEPLTAYLDDDDSGIKRWQLCQRIAECFDRYQSYRPALVASWSAGAEQHWQAQLWRRITLDSGIADRVQVMKRLCACLQPGSTDVALPKRISLFALSRLAPIYLEVVAAMAEQTEILFFQHNPTDEYWADLVSDKEKARRRLQNPVLGEYLESGNSLLSSWGRQGQALQDMMIDLGPLDTIEIEDNQPPAGTELLPSLQSGLYHLEKARLPVELDDSVSVQLCHSPLRECQVLHDHLLKLLDRHSDLFAEDILVMVPEINRYAPYIEAVFQADPGHRRPNLAWNISDVSISEGHPLAKVFIELLALPNSRFTRSEVLAFLDCAEIRACFGIDASMRESIHRLTAAAEIRWGIDARHKRTLGLPAVHENSWEQGWQRLFAGYAMTDATIWHDIAPVDDVVGDDAIAVGRFRHLFDRLEHWRQRLQQSATAEAWQQRLHQLIDEFLAPPGANDDALLPLRESFIELGQSGADELTAPLVNYWLRSKLETRQQPGHLYSGGISFCGMQPMRNIPFAVICVLGMQDNAFPRRQPNIEFDLMRSGRRAGDPHKGDEDRYLMLETLLCARRYLYFSYCANSLQDNSECQPSVLLRELLDYIDSCSPGLKSASDQICQRHPMQAFSTRNFREERPGYDGFWFETARNIANATRPSDQVEWPQTPLAVPNRINNTVDLGDLVRFFQHPLRYFFAERLGIRLPRQQVEDDDEAFSLQGLQKWSLAQQLATEYLADAPISQTLYRARGLLPHGRAAESEWFGLLSEYRGLLEQLEPFREGAAEVRSIECALGREGDLFGEVVQCFDGLGLMHYSASRKISSRALISLWLNHLALAAAGQLKDGERSQLFAASSRGWYYPPLPAEDAKLQLQDYVKMYRQGQSCPLPVFPESSYQWAAESEPGRALEKARSAWEGGDYAGAPAGESADPLICLALPDSLTAPFDDSLFQSLAQRIYLPAISHGGEID